MGKKRKKITRAGRMRRVSIYPQVRATDSPRERAAKQRCSTAAQQIYNRKLSREKCEDLLAENFDVGDFFVTLTYGNGHLPATRKTADGRMKAYITAVRAYCRARHLPDPTILWVTEEKHGDGRLHHHMVIRSWPNCYKVLRALWRHGEDVDIKKLRVDAEKNYESLARYLCKEAPTVGKHQWHVTKNVSRPDVYTCWVDASETVQPPKGSLIFSSGSYHNQFASYQYAVYLLPLQRRRGKRK